MCEPYLILLIILNSVANSFEHDKTDRSSSHNIPKVARVTRRDSIRIIFDLLLETPKRKDGISKTYAVRRANLNFHSITHTI